jgi:hypothetical protein
MLEVHGLDCVSDLGMPQDIFTTKFVLHLFREFTRRKTVLRVSVAVKGGQLLGEPILKK